MYDFFAFLKKEKIEDRFKKNDNLYYLHSRIDRVLNKNIGKRKYLYFNNNKKSYDLSDDVFLKNRQIDNPEYKKTFSFKIHLTSPLFTASENKFYSISNPIAKERATGLPILKGSSLKGALRHAAVVNIENELLEKNYCNNFLYYSDLEKKVEIQEIVKKEEDENDRFYFKKRSQLVKLFGNEREPKWFTIKSLLATGGIKDVKNVKDILEKINNAFEHYLKKKQIVNSEGVSRGRLIFEDLHFKKVTLDVITPLDREKKTPVRGPIFYEVIPAGQEVTGKLLWFPFDLIAKGELEKIEDEWNEDKKIIEKAFKELSKTGIGAKTKDGWGRFEWEALDES